MMCKRHSTASLGNKLTHRFPNMILFWNFVVLLRFRCANHQILFWVLDLIYISRLVIQSSQELCWNDGHIDYHRRLLKPVPPFMILFFSLSDLFQLSWARMMSMKNEYKVTKILTLVELQSILPHGQELGHVYKAIGGSLKGCGEISGATRTSLRSLEMEVIGVNRSYRP